MNTQDLMQVDWRADTSQNAVQVVPVGQETVHVTGTDQKPTIEEGFLFPSFGTSLIARTDTPILIGAGARQLIIGSSPNARIVQRAVAALILRGAKLESIALSLFVPDDLEENFFEAARTTGMRNFLITSLTTLVGGKGNVEIVRPALAILAGHTLH